MSEIYFKLAAVQQKLRVPKAQYNSFGKYSYRSAEGILEAVKPVLAEYGLLLFLSDEVEQKGERYYIKATATIYDLEDNSSISVSASARESDSKKGMDSSQLTGTASSYARKYCLNGLFLLDDSKDADTDEFHTETSSGNLTALKKTVKAECEKRGIDPDKWLARSNKTMDTATGAELSNMLKALKEMAA